MIVSPDALRKETVAIYKAVEAEIQAFELEAKARGKSPFQVVDTNGNALYASLMATKTTALNTLVMLNEPRNRTHER